MALYEAGDVGPPDKLHLDGPGPAQHHHEGPDPVLAPVIAEVAKAAPVHLGLLAGTRLEAQGRLGLAGTPTGTDIVGHRRVTAFISEGADLPQQDVAILQTLGEPVVDVVGVGSSLDPRRGRGCGLITSGDFR